MRHSILAAAFTFVASLVVICAAADLLNQRERVAMIASYSKVLHAAAGVTFLVPYADRESVAVQIRETLLQLPGVAGVGSIDNGYRGLIVSAKAEWSGRSPTSADVAAGLVITRGAMHPNITDHLNTMSLLLEPYSIADTLVPGKLEGILAALMTFFAWLVWFRDSASRTRRSE